jgi:hypothetical protein
MQTTRESFPQLCQNPMVESRPVFFWARLVLILPLFAVATVLATAQNNAQWPLANSTPRPTGILLPAANRLPDANQVMEMREKKAKDQNFAAANALRKKQMADDTDRMIKLIADLKTEIDKASKDELSLTVIRKADEIERLAHNIKEKMKLTAGPG